MTGGASDFGRDFQDPVALVCFVTGFSPPGETIAQRTLRTQRTNSLAAEPGIRAAMRATDHARYQNSWLRHAPVFRTNLAHARGDLGAGNLTARLSTQPGRIVAMSAVFPKRDLRQRLDEGVACKSASAISRAAADTYLNPEHGSHSLRTAST